MTRLNVGGPSFQAVILTSRLDPGRFDPYLVIGTAGADEGDMLELRPHLRRSIENKLFHIEGLGRSPRPSSDLLALSRLFRLIGEMKPDIVHTHLAKAGTLGRLASILRRVPVKVHTFHGTVFEGHFHPFIAKALVGWERGLSQSTNRIVAVSDAVANDLIRRGFPRSKIRVIPLGLDLDDFAAVAPLRQRSNVVMLVARLVPVKDVDLFVETVRVLRRRIPEVRAVVVGDGPLRHRLESTAPEFVSFLGNRSDVPALLDEAGVVMLTSRSEGSPVALIEALAAGRPVVAPAVGGIPDVLRDRLGTLLVDTREPEALAAAAARVLEDEAFAAGAEVSRGSVREEFGADRLVADIEDLYEQAWRDRFA